MYFKAAMPIFVVLIALPNAPSRDYQRNTQNDGTNDHTRSKHNSC
jgi:hypothetical protein